MTPGEAPSIHVFESFLYLTIVMDPSLMGGEGCGSVPSGSDAFKELTLECAAA